MYGSAAGTVMHRHRHRPRRRASVAGRDGACCAPQVREGWQELRGSISDIVSFMAGEEAKPEASDAEVPEKTDKAAEKN